MTDEDGNKIPYCESEDAVPTCPGCFYDGPKCDDSYDGDHTAFCEGKIDMGPMFPIIELPTIEAYCVPAEPSEE